MLMSPKFPIRNTRVVDRDAELLRLCANKKILHMGCADMPYTMERGERLLHGQLDKITGEGQLWGLDMSAEGVRHLEELGFRDIICANVEDMSDQLRDMEFDILLAAEILEHVANPGLFLENLVAAMSDTTELIMTTPNAMSLRGFIYSMLRQEKVHPDHNYYFSYRTLQQLLEKFGLKCVDVYYYQAVEGEGAAWWFDHALKLATHISGAWGDGLIVRAIRAT